MQNDNISYFNENNQINESNYLIVNDTNLILHVKQYETEETLILNKGQEVFYTWRTHKKSQLLQLYIPEYQTYSIGFKIDEINNLELDLSNDRLNNNLFQIILLVIVKDLNGAQKKIIIQSNLVICNFLNFSIKVDISDDFEKK